ncbi:MAG: HD-GYP domain-containing protein [Negativicutes bacterium]|nr:HD-GYP domain-containing protein [Negativicutes bacterium]
MPSPIRKCSISDLRPGMVVAKFVSSIDGCILVEEDAVLTQKQIQHLAAWGIVSIEIKESPAGSSPDKAASYDRFAKKQSGLIRTLSEAFEKVRVFKQVPEEQLVELADQSMELLVDDAGVLGYLSIIRDTDDYTYRHSVNVGIIAGLLGKWLGAVGADLRETILTGLLHDIGKTQIPLTILHKPGKLDAEEWRIIRQHPSLGVELLRPSNRFSEESLQGILQHHERLDGSGYQSKLAGSDIAIRAKIIALADIYDAMTSTRVYQAAASPFAVLEELFGLMFTKLDQKMCSLFIAKARESFIGSIVRLSDGSQAKVIALDQAAVAKPILKLKAGNYINLAQRSDLKIVEIVAL